LGRRAPPRSFEFGPFRFFGGPERLFFRGSRGKEKAGEGPGGGKKKNIEAGEGLGLGRLGPARKREKGARFLGWAGHWGTEVGNQCEIEGGFIEGWGGTGPGGREGCGKGTYVAIVVVCRGGGGGPRAGGGENQTGPGRERIGFGRPRGFRPPGRGRVSSGRGSWRQRGGARSFRSSQIFSLWVSFFFDFWLHGVGTLCPPRRVGTGGGPRGDGAPIWNPGILKLAF